MRGSVPARLRPTALFAADAILVGDPGRALLLAQELLEKPKMSNHARGLWGYSGQTPAGRELTIQATGMGGPSAAMVVADLAKLEVRRVVRVGTCTALNSRAKIGELLLVNAVLGAGGSATSFGVAVGEELSPDPGLLERLGSQLGDEAQKATVASFDALPAGADLADRVAAADMQTFAVLARAQQLEIAAAAVLIVTETTAAEQLGSEELDRAAVRCGIAAAEALSNPKVEG